MKLSLSLLGAMFLAMAARPSSGAPVPPPTTDLKAGPLTISKASKDIIIYYEVGGASYYTSRLQFPTVPPGFSGITIGIGYDLGYNSRDQIQKDWGGKLPQAQVDRLKGVAGLKQASAKAALARVKDIRIPWDTALAVYDERTVPRFAALTAKAYPGLKNMNPDIQGIILSTSFNRGTSFAGDRRRELLWTRNDVKIGKADKLGTYQLQMRRLWPNILGLQRRYTAHAGLIEKSLQKQ